MEDIIKLKSRGDTQNYLKKIKKPNGEESKTYILKSDIPSLRAGYIEDNNMFIDPPGGPMIIVNHLLKEAGSIVKSIDFIKDYGYIITFK